MDIKKNITFRDMQDMLPDYILNRISDEEREIFEQNLPNYPELSSEMERTREVFSKLENIDLKSRMQEHTRYLSYKVLNKMQETQKRNVISRFAYRYALPAFGVVIAVFLLMNNWNGNYTGKISDSAFVEKNTDNSNDNPILTSSDVAFLEESNVGDKELSVVSDGNSEEGIIDVMSENETDISFVDDMFYEVVSDGISNINKSSELLMNTLSDVETELYENLNKLSDEELKIILKALEDVEISV